MAYEVIKKGDRVRIIKEKWNEGFVGLDAVIVRVDTGAHVPYYVETDSGRCCWLDGECIEPSGVAIMQEWLKR